MAERANEQTQILERDIAYLNDSLKRHSDTTEKRFDILSEEQRHQWEEIKETRSVLTELRLTVKGIGTTSAIYAAIGSVIGSAVITTLVGVLLLRLLNS